MSHEPEQYWDSVGSHHNNDHSTEQALNDNATTAYIRIVITIAILASAVMIAIYFMSHPPKTEKQEQVDTKTVVVITQDIKFGNHPIEIEVMGQVRAAREAALKTQVSGEIISVSNNFLPGGSVKKGEEILSIDTADYELDLQMKQATLKQNEAAYKLEQGQQEIAKNELKMLQKTTGKKLRNTDLALRLPQLEQAKANLDMAQADLDMAQLNLNRASIKAPFNALITMRNTDLGNIVSTQDTLATLVSTDEYWVDIEVPVHHMRWLNIPSAANNQTGSKALITLDGNRGTRAGSLLKITGTLNQQSRLANILVSVQDPLLLNSTPNDHPPLIIGDYVKTTLTGKTLKNSVRLKQNLVHDGQTVWLMRDNKLRIQPVQIAYEDRFYAYIIGGIENGDRIVTSDIITPIDGMDIREKSDIITPKVTTQQANEKAQQE